MSRRRTRRMLAAAVCGAALAGGALLLFWKLRRTGPEDQGPDTQSALAHFESVFGSDARPMARNIWFVRKPNDEEYMRFDYANRDELFRRLSRWDPPVSPRDKSESCSGPEDLPAWWDVPLSVVLYDWGPYRVCVDEKAKRTYFYRKPGS